MNLWVAQGVAFFLVFAFCVLVSASETALLSLSRPRIKKLIAQRRDLAWAFGEWLSSPQYLLTSLLIGGTLGSVLITVLATSMAMACWPQVSHGWLETATWLAMTLVLFVFADFIPKSFARDYPERISIMSLRWIGRGMRWAKPWVEWFFRWMKYLLPLKGAPVGALSVYSLEELREMIQTSALQGSVPRRAGQMMERALTLHKIPVSRLMTPYDKVQILNLGQDPELLLDQIAEMGRTRVPVYRVHPRKIGGYLHVKDLLLVWRGALPLRLDALVRQPFYVSPETPASKLLEDFRRGQSHLAVVADAQGDCQGIVTLEDILEEIMGEILDEYDIEQSRGVS